MRKLLLIGILTVNLMRLSAQANDRKPAVDTEGVPRPSSVYLPQARSVGGDEEQPSLNLQASDRPASAVDQAGSIAAPAIKGTWVEVRLPDNRRAWAPVAGLVVGSWQPLPPQAVLDIGRSFIGAPYKWGGVDPNGWDCSGFMQEVFRLGGHQIPRLADAQYEACDKVERSELEPGDMVFFNTDGSGISHVGIYTGQNRFLHASSSRGVVEDSLDDSYFARAYVGAGRISDWRQFVLQPHFQDDGQVAPSSGSDSDFKRGSSR